LGLPVCNSGDFYYAKKHVEVSHEGDMCVNRQVSLMKRLIIIITHDFIEDH